MIDFVTDIKFNGLPKEKEDEVREWVKVQNEKMENINPYWRMNLCRFDGYIAIYTNYHYNRMRLPLYIYQLYQKFHDQCNMKVEVYSDMNGGCTAEDYYQLDEAILTDEDWAEWLKEYPDEDTINRIFDELWENFRKSCEETVNHTSDRQIAFVNALKAVDKLKDDEDENPDFTEEDLEKAADEINQAIINDMKNNIPDLPF
jgi:hypothetical protein